MRSAMRVARAAARNSVLRQQTRAVSSLLRMPAMSPTMTEGGIAGWKKKEGESFEAGDVILEVETDKATIDVEAQDDGVMGKILFDAGSKNVPVGEVIAVLAEEGDDLAKLQVPKDLSPEAQNIPTEDKKEKEAPKEAPMEDKSEEAPKDAKPIHKSIDVGGKPVFPSVMNLLLESDMSQEQISKIKPTGKNGMLTRGDVLAALGKISNPYGSAENLIANPMGASGKRANEAKESPKAGAAAPPAKPLSGAELRRLIVQGMSKATAPRPLPASGLTPTASAKVSDAEFDDILGDYATLLPPSNPPVARENAKPQEDELAGIA